MRTLRENKNCFNREDKTIIPITGFSCWALGYVDGDYKRVGCLLHPAQNRGTDLRYRINYGEKCSRETCQEEKIFSRLEETDKNFWLRLSDGLDSFAYSSRANNPLFLMLGWGTHLLRQIAQEEGGKPMTREWFFRSYSFFKTGLLPKGNAYIINRLVSNEGLRILRRVDMSEKVEAFLSRMKIPLIHGHKPSEEGPHTHLLDMDPLFLDFLRITLGISRIRPDHAVELKKAIDKEIGTFKADGDA